MGQMIGLAWLAMVTFAFSSSAAASERELGAHLHGNGRVNIAIEGHTLWIELEAPGADLVGFEHAAKSDEDQSAIAAVRERLSAPSSLFALPAAAGCTVETAEVTVAGLNDHQGHDEKGHDEAERLEGHSEFHATYMLACENPERVDRVVFTYFEAFPAAEELQVHVITAAGQARYEVERDAPGMTLSAD